MQVINYNDLCTFYCKQSNSQDKPDGPSHVNKMPRKDSEDGRESRWGPSRQDPASSRGSSRGGRGSYRQNQDSNNSSWNKSSNSRIQRLVSFRN